MRRTISIFCSLFFLISLIIACQKDTLTTFETLNPVLPTTPHDYSSWKFPSHFANSAITAEQRLHRHPITDEGATLGRVLFYDPVLSLNNKVACASCHKQAQAFADPAPLSQGFKGAVTTRNSMSIVNPVLNNNMFWDSRVPTVHDLVLEPVRNHIEMGMENMEQLTTKLSHVAYYPDLFEKAYGTKEITSERVADALTQFLNSMVSFNAKFDEGVEHEFANFNALEEMGRQLFFSAKTQCSSCHNGANFSAPDGNFGFTNINDNLDFHITADIISTDHNPYGSTGGGSRGTANIGLDVNYEDEGRENGNFKIPSLRNIALTAPYMHDGRFNTLEQVINHYDKGVQPHNHLDDKFRNASGLPARMGLTDLEKKALIAFLHTLTDESFIKDQRFSNPFYE